MNRIRLLPLLMTAISCLLLLKLAGLWLGIGPEVQGVVSAYAQTAEDQTAEDQTEQADPAPDEADQPATADENTDAAMAAAEDPPLETNPDEVGEIVSADTMSPARIAILQRLVERRQALDAYQRELELRENLLDATEKRLQEKLEELKVVEARIQGAIGARDEEQQAQLEGLVVMYENMKPKDAARIFDRLEMPVLIGLVQQMNARKMAEILAKMSSEAAEALTVEISRRGQQDAVPMPISADGELPRVDSAN